MCGLVEKYESPNYNTMVYYNLEHLTQDDQQAVVGPIQDDEALFLFSLIRCMRFSRILEVGGLDGYSAKNFLESLDCRPNAMVYTIDIQPVEEQGSLHRCIQKNASDITANDVDNQPLDLVFFDCHELDVQMTLFERLRSSSIINDDTVLALHDTGLHEHQFIDWAYEIQDGWVHQPVERQMVNRFKEAGYDVFTVDAKRGTSTPEFPFRHGLTICKKHSFMVT